MSISTIQNAGLASTARLGIREVVRQLNGALGATLVSALTGSKDPRISYKWARERGPEPRPAAVQRLLLAHRAWRLVSETEGEHVTRLWFIGTNPWLDEISPIEAIGNLESKKVMNAAQAMVEDNFAGCDVSAQRPVWLSTKGARAGRLPALVERFNMKLL